MGSKVEDEDYWNSSNTAGFSFDDEGTLPVSSLFEYSKNVSNKDRQDAISSSNSMFQEQDKPLKAEKPLESLLTKKTLAVICKADRKKTYKDSTEELAILRRLVCVYDEPPPAADTVRLIILEQPYFLVGYRSLFNKTQLLEEAVKSGDGNAILCIVLFLRNTLKKKIFCRLLQSKPAAVAVYINYLTTRYEVRTTVDTLLLLGLSKDAAIKDFQFLIQPQQSLDKRLHNLRALIRDHYSTPDIDDKDFVENFKKFVEWQVNNRQTPGRPVQALHGLCSNHWNIDRSSPLSPYSLSTLLNICERQFQWTAVSSLAAKESYGDLAGLLFANGWFGKKLKSVIAPDKIIVELHKHKTPEKYLLEYFELIDDLDKRLELGRKLSWHKAAIDTFSAMRDRQGLMQYKATLNPQSNDYLHAETSLRSNIKWKN